MPNISKNSCNLKIKKTLNINRDELNSQCKRKHRPKNERFWFEKLKHDFKFQ